jgi:multidrug efflux system membrane fusion protein
MNTNHFRAAVSLCLLAIITVFLSGCSTQTVQTAPIMAVPVRVAKAVEKTVPIDLTAIGTSEAYAAVSVKSQVNGIIQQVHFTQGDIVKKGELLFTLDARPFQAALEQAQATLARDKAQADLDEVQARRYEALYQAGVAAKEQLDTFQATAGAQAAAVRADQSAVEAARLQVEYCSIYAPIEGRTGAVGATAGNTVKQNDLPILVVINQISPIYMDFAIPEQYLGPVKKYMTAGRLAIQATPYGDTNAETGYLSFVDNNVDNTTGTVKLKGTFANTNDRLVPGQFSTVSLRLSEQEDATVVPSQAVQTGQSNDFIFVIKADSTAEQRVVKVARTIGGESVIASGISPGETVVVDGQLRLIPGIKVRVDSDAAGS